MVNAYLEEKQENGRYKPVKGTPITDPGIIYKCLVTALYRHSLNRHCNRIKSVKLNNGMMQFVVTHSGNKYRSVYTVDNLGW